MANIKIADLKLTDSEIFFDAELSPEEIAAIIGGGFWGTVIGGAVGALGLFAGPVGGVTIIMGMQIGNAVEDKYFD
ncbi:MAG: hypothetical protein HC862_32375 [Scytonema sp. RU_4_4]|nr:hypothetical protein [Scytonema sp. RU_4_4]NJR74760.1 hypothetical protein [Scytonema sp. CRU_2_7]